LTEDEEFVSAVVSPNYRNALLLEMAAQGRPDLLHTLIRLGADVNHTPSGGVPHVGLTPLMRAARQGCRECVRLLVDAKADVTLASERGATALHEACDANHEEVAVVLISAGCDPEARDRRGWSPLDAMRRTAPPAARRQTSGGSLPGFSSGFLGGSRQRREAAARIQLLVRGARSAPSLHSMASSSLRPPCLLRTPPPPPQASCQHRTRLLPRAAAAAAAAAAAFAAAAWVAVGRRRSLPFTISCGGRSPRTG
jgi:hypothetical protein